MHSNTSSPNANWLIEMLETPAAPSPELEILPCGHEGKKGMALCFVCDANMRQEICQFGRAHICKICFQEN